MKVFDNLEKQQAELYRWMRKKIDFRFFHRLTGLETAEKMSEMSIDAALLEACHREKAYDAAFDVQHRSKIRSGIFPAQLGFALEEFVRSRIQLEAMKAYSERSATDTDLRFADEQVKMRFLALCEEMAKLR